MVHYCHHYGPLVFVFTSETKNTLYYRLEWQCSTRRWAWTCRCAKFWLEMIFEVEEKAAKPTCGIKSVSSVRLPPPSRVLFAYSDPPLQRRAFDIRTPDECFKYPEPSPFILLQDVKARSVRLGHYCYHSYCWYCCCYYYYAQDLTDRDKSALTRLSLIFCHLGLRTFTQNT